MAINSKQTLIDYCKRRLGDPVIEINVDEDQVDDRIDEALDLFKEFHSDGVLKMYLKHQITADDVTNGYISVASDVAHVTRMMAGSSSNSTMGGSWSVKYQLMLNDVMNYSTWMADLAYYTMIQTNLAMLDMQLNGLPIVNFSQHANKVYIHGEFETKSIKAGDYVVFEIYQVLDPDTHTSIYNDKFIKAMSTALIKQQWGTNLSKFEGMQLPGGVTMNGATIYEQATAEVEKLKEDLRMEHELPADFFVG